VPLGMRHGLPAPHPQSKNFATGRWAAIRNGPTVPNGTIVPHTAGRSIGPPVQPGTGPRTEFPNFLDQRSYRRGPVRSDPVLDRKPHTPNDELCTLEVARAPLCVQAKHLSLVYSKEIATNHLPQKS